VSGGRLVYAQKKTGAEINVPLLPQLKAAIEAMPALAQQERFLETKFGEAFTETGFYNWFTRKAQRAGVPEGRSPHGLRKASCRRLAEAGCSPHEIMSVSGHETLKEVERYTKAANRARLADSAIAALQSAQKEALRRANQDRELANRPGNVSHSTEEDIDLSAFSGVDGGGGFHTMDGASYLFIVPFFSIAFG